MHDVWNFIAFPPAAVTLLIRISSGEERASEWNQNPGTPALWTESPCGWKKRIRESREDTGREEVGPTHEVLIIRSFTFVYMLVCAGMNTCM